MRSKLTLFLMILHCIACQTAQMGDPSASPQDDASTRDDASAREEGLSMSELTAPSLSNEALQELFKVEEENIASSDHHIRYCKDDIYTSHLKDTYYRNLEEKRKGRLNSRQKQRHDTDARFFAMQRVDGTTPRYFGGLPVAITPRVEKWIHYYKTKGREQFLKWLVRSEAQKELVIPFLIDEGLPKELFFLAMIESGFNNSAYSRKHATGTWQFMKPTARSYGLRINYWVDERMDPTKSTVAAARYLRDLYAQFNDWFLAIAAYNAGPGKIRSSIRRAKSRDYWRIAQTNHLSQETKQYVPKILAALVLASHPERHGFTVAHNEGHSTPINTIPVPRAAKLSEVANLLAVPVATLKKWNPELIRDIVPPPHKGKPYRLRMPEPYAKRFPEIEPQLTKLAISDVLMHRIKAGETLTKIARHYRVKIKEILLVNPRLKPERLRIGHEIAIPVPTVNEA